MFLAVGIAAAFDPDGPAELLVLRDPPTRTDAALVFGGDPRFERTAHAARLFHRGLVERLILCGGEPGPGDDAESLKKVAIEHGVAEDRILLEERSTSTREAVVFAKPLLEQNGVRSLTLVTSPYHQRRAYLSARRVLGDGVRLVNSPVDPSFWSPEGWWKHWSSIRIVLVEYTKLGYYAARGWLRGGA